MAWFLYPGLLFQARHHDDRRSPLLPHHPPKVPESLRQRTLGSDVGVLLPVAVDVVGVDVVAPQDSCKNQPVLSCSLRR